MNTVPPPIYPPVSEEHHRPAVQSTASRTMCLFQGNDVAPLCEFLRCEKDGDFLPGSYFHVLLQRNRESTSVHSVSTRHHE